jgi:uncharacterized protein (DUF1330 family)
VPHRAHKYAKVFFFFSSEKKTLLIPSVRYRHPPEKQDNEYIMHFENELYPSTDWQREEMFKPGPPGPIVMVNLLKFKDQAAYEDGRACNLSGRDAYAIYGRAVVPMIMGVGGRLLFGAEVSFLMLGQADPLWDQVALAEYPDRAALVRMASSPEYQEIAVHRTAGLAGQLNIETLPRFNLADLLSKA